jgi:hypothetical protein
LLLSRDWSRKIIGTMRKVLIILLVILLIPAFLVTFVVIHELGHTILARLLGDPNSVFYLARIEEHSACLGCNIYDQTKLSWGANLVVSLGGLLATQFVALIALFFLGLRPGKPFRRRIMTVLALGFAFLDVPVQVIQGMLYNLNQESLPTNVDLVDFMLLVQEKVRASQILLKGAILLASILYLVGFVWFYEKTKVLSTPSKDWT